MSATRSTGRVRPRQRDQVCFGLLRIRSRHQQKYIADRKQICAARCDAPNP
jgi:hypothetical protein